MPALHRRVIQLLFLPLVAMMLFASSSHAQEMQDVVYLKDGSVIRGVIVEQIPGESLRIQTSDGSIFRYTMDQIERMTKEPAQQQEPAQQVVLQSPKSPGTAWALSFLIPGGGQFYNGDTGDGVLYLVAHVVFAGWFTEESSCVGSDCDDSQAGLAALFLVGNWVISQVDAYRGAKAFNARLAGGEVELIPEFQLRPADTLDRTELGVEVSLLRWNH